MSACLRSFQRCFCLFCLGLVLQSAEKPVTAGPWGPVLAALQQAPLLATARGFRGSVKKLAHGGICAAWLMRSQYAGCVWIHQPTLVCCCNGCQLCSHTHLWLFFSLLRWQLFCCWRCENGSATSNFCSSLHTFWTFLLCPTGVKMQVSLVRSGKLITHLGSSRATASVGVV